MKAQTAGSATQVLLVEPDGLVRGTVASVCRDLDLVHIVQATSLTQGEHCLQASPLHGLMLSLADGDAALTCWRGCARKRLPAMRRFRWWSWPALAPRRRRCG